MEEKQLTEDDKKFIENNFVYHPPKGDQAKRYQEIRESFKKTATLILQSCPDSAQRQQALLLLLNSNMMANASIACNE